MTGASAVSNRDEVARWLPTVPREQLRRAKFALVEVDSRIGSETDLLLSLSKERGVVPRAEFGDPAGRADSLSDYKVVKPGQIVMNKMQAWNGVFGLSDLSGVVSPDYSVFAVLEGWDPRYVTYLLRSDFYTTQFGWRSRGMGTAFLRLHPENLLDTPLVAPSLEDQSRIADYLEGETRRIDMALDLRRRTNVLLDEATRAVLDAAFASPSTRRTKLKHLLAQSPCYGVLVPNFVEVGVPFVRVGDLALMRSEEVPGRYISEAQSREYARTRLALGDVLLSVVGSIDKVRVVSPALVGSNIARAVCRLVPLAGVPSELLALWLRGTAYLDQARQATSSDTAQPTLGMGDLANFEVWFPEPSTYGEFKTRLQQRLDTLAAARNGLQRQVDVMAERRQALITAAVTGQLDIPGVAA